MFRILTSFLSNVDFPSLSQFSTMDNGWENHLLCSFVILVRWVGALTISNSPHHSNNCQSASQQPEYCATMFCDCSPHIPTVHKMKDPGDVGRPQRIETFSPKNFQNSNMAGYVCTFYRIVQWKMSEWQWLWLINANRSEINNISQ